MFKAIPTNNLVWINFPTKRLFSRLAVLLRMTKCVSERELTHQTEPSGDTRGKKRDKRLNREWMMVMMKVIQMMLTTLRQLGEIMDNLSYWHCYPARCTAELSMLSALVLNSFSVARRVQPKATIGALNSVTYLIENAVLCPIMLQTQ